MNKITVNYVPEEKKTLRLHTVDAHHIIIIIIKCFSKRSYLPTHTYYADDTQTMVCKGENRVLTAKIR